MYLPYCNVNCSMYVPYGKDDCMYECLCIYGTIVYWLAGVFCVGEKIIWVMARNCVGIIAIGILNIPMSCAYIIVKDVSKFS